MYVFLDGIKINQGGLDQIIYSGDAVWGNNGINIKIIHFWGIQQGDVETVSLFEILDDIGTMVKAYDEIVVFNIAHTEFVKINISTKVVSAVITIPHPVDCTPVYDNFKLWFITDYIEPDSHQDLFYYNIDGGSPAWSDPRTIPGRYQKGTRLIEPGYNGYVYVQLLNESGVAKFDSNTGLYSSTITTNRSPSCLHMNQSRELLVAGFNGMVSSINTATDVSTNISGTVEEVDNIVDDGAYLWTNIPSLARITKGTSTNNYIVMQDVPQVNNETHNDVYLDYGFGLNTPDIISVTVRENLDAGGTTNLVDGTDYTFEIDPVWGEQRLTILSTAPNITEDEPLSIGVDYTYNPAGIIKDYNIIGFTESVFSQIMIIPSFSYEEWTGTVFLTVNVPQYIVALSNSALYFAYNLTDSWTLPDPRFYELTIQGTALVGTGLTIYHGETQ